MARRLMYWQVYLHKTAIAGETMLIQILRRAKDLINKGTKLHCSKALMLFLKKEYTWEEFTAEPKLLIAFTDLDDHDVWAAIKTWKDSDDKILSLLCSSFLSRKLFTCKLGSQPLPKSKHIEISEEIKSKLQITDEELSYFVIEGSTSNSAYVQGDNTIKIVDKQGQVVELTEASDLPTIQALSKIVKKYYFCCPKSVYLQDDLNTQS
jgi:HD superfamily phosphohydrolase